MLDKLQPAASIKMRNECFMHYLAIEEGAQDVKNFEGSYQKSVS